MPSSTCCCNAARSWSAADQLLAGATLTGGRPLALALAVAAAGTAPALAASPSASVKGWPEVSGAALVGRSFVLASSARQSNGTLTYYEAVTLSVALNSTRTRFVSALLSNEVVVRSSVGPMPGSRLAAGNGGYLFNPGGPTPTPVIWCCVDDTEVVLESDGKPGARIAAGMGVDGDRVRVLFRVRDGVAELASWSPQRLTDADAPDPTAANATVPGSPRGGTTAIATGIAAWSDDPAAGSLTVGVPGDAGVADPVTVALAGRVLDVKADAGTAVATVRVGRRYRVLLVSATGAVTRAWQGAVRPQTAAAQGIRVVGAGRTVFVDTGGGLRRVSGTRGSIAAVAAGGTRVGWAERVTRRTVTRRGKRRVVVRERRTVARLARVPS